MSRSGIVLSPEGFADAIASIGHCAAQNLIIAHNFYVHDMMDNQERQLQLREVAGDYETHRANVITTLEYYGKQISKNIPERQDTAG